MMKRLKRYTALVVWMLSILLLYIPIRLYVYNTKRFPRWLTRLLEALDRLEETALSDE